MTTEKFNIALIDDHHLLSQSLSSLLSKYDFINSIQLFSKPQDYFDAVPDPEPDIIVSDIMMPGMSGIDLLLRFKQEHKKMKVILLSSITEYRQFATHCEVVQVVIYVKIQARKNLLMH
jgi:DNA-binding NarL/FixJ family response regulator